MKPAKLVKLGQPPVQFFGAYAYNVAGDTAFGKWHNTPATESTAVGPKDRRPNGYDFLAGETSQYEPRLVENCDAVEPPLETPFAL